MSPDVDDRTYHGFMTEVEPATEHTFARHARRIDVLDGDCDWSARADGKAIATLEAPDESVDFSWGYSGYGPRQSALALLADALGYEPTPEMARYFEIDVVQRLPCEWLLGRSAILRWAQGFLLEQQGAP